MGEETDIFWFYRGSKSNSNSEFSISISGQNLSKMNHTKASAACIVSALRPALTTSIENMALDGEVQIKVDEVVKLDIPIEIETSSEQNTKVSFSNMRLTGDLRIYVEQPIILKLPIMVEPTSVVQEEKDTSERCTQINFTPVETRTETAKIEREIVDFEEERVDTPRPPIFQTENIQFVQNLVSDFVELVIFK